MITAVEILRRARAFIARGWCQHHAADTGNAREEVDPHSPRAARWCIQGAMRAAQGAERVPEAWRCLTGCLEWPFHSLPHYNDSTRRTQAQVLAFFDRAIALASARQADA